MGQYTFHKCRCFDQDTGRLQVKAVTTTMISDVTKPYKPMSEVIARLTLITLIRKCSIRNHM
jgi:hypothetical protein